MKTSAFLVIIGRLWLSHFALSETQSAQQPAGAESDVGQEPTITVDVDLVNVFFTVTDRRDELFTGLTRDDFRVYEDDVLQTITNFDSETDLPLTIALLVDTSGSIRDRLRFELRF